MRGRKGEPTDKESDRVIGRFGNGIQKGNIFGANRLDIVHKSCEKKREKGEEKREREKIVSKDKAGETECDPIHQKGFFLDLSFDERAVSFGWMVDIEWSIGYFIYDVIGCGDCPCEKKCQQGFPDKRQYRGG